VFLLRYFLVSSFFVLHLSANDSIDGVLKSYYQSLVDTYSFYYEIDIKTEDYYGKKIIDNSFTLDKVIDSENIEESTSPSINELNTDDLSQHEDSTYTNGIALYKEIREDSYVAIIKSSKSQSNAEEAKDKSSFSAETFLSIFKHSSDSFSYYPLSVDNYDFNLLDYLTIYHKAYDFEVIKNVATDYFYRGTLKPEIAEQTTNLFFSMQVKFSKKYNIPTKIILYDKENKVAISIEVDSVEKIKDYYVASKFIVYNDGKKITISLHNIQTGVPIDIENNYKITLNDYMKLINEDNN
jgi:hypothetical protein